VGDRPKDRGSLLHEDNFRNEHGNIAPSGSAKLSRDNLICIQGSLFLMRYPSSRSALCRLRGKIWVSSMRPW
jgi:hypothetical protein